MRLSPAIEPVSDAEEADDDVQEVEGPAPEYYDDEPDQEVPEAGVQVSVVFLGFLNTPVVAYVPYMF